MMIKVTLILTKSFTCIVNYSENHKFLYKVNSPLFGIYEKRGLLIHESTGCMGKDVTETQCKVSITIFALVLVWK